MVYQYSKAIYEATKDHISIDKPYLLTNLSSSTNPKILKENSFFSILSIISGSTHMYINHNRRFYFDPFHDGLRPVYYDGQPSAYESFMENINATKMITRNHLNYDFQNAFKKIEEIDINSLHKRINKSGVKLTLKKVNQIKKQLLIVKVFSSK